MRKTASYGVAVPPPLAPGDSNAWYAPDVRAQYVALYYALNWFFTNRSQPRFEYADVELAGQRSQSQLLVSPFDCPPPTR